MGLKYSRKPYCKQMCCHPGFVVPFLEHRQNRFNIILKGPRIFGVVNEHWLQIKVTSALTPNKKISLSFEALKPDIDFCLAMKVLDAIFFQYEAVSSTLKICCLVEPPSLMILDLLDKLLQLLHQHLPLHIALLGFEDGFLP